MAKIIKSAGDCGETTKDDDAVRLRFWSGPMVHRMSKDGLSASVDQELHYEVIGGAE